MDNTFFQVKVYSHNQPPHDWRSETHVWVSKKFNSLEEAKKEAELWKKQRKAHAEIDNSNVDPNEADWTVIDKIVIEQITIIEEI